MARKQPEKGFNFSLDMIEDSDKVPALLREFRSDAWHAYQELPFPTLKDEAWRRTALSGLDFKKIQLPNGKAVPEKITGSILTESILAKKSVALLSPAGVEINQTAKLKKQGVIFLNLTEAAEKHPDLVGKVLGKVVSPRDGKFAAATAAFANHGIFIYVPKGVQVDEPLFSIGFAP
ncbi:MAG: hypothetical protein KAU23_11585, partial [Anaerolineales bacterium]|nr:hypothetical protein [Anaerolineales bacterium]